MSIDRRALLKAGAAVSAAAAMSNVARADVRFDPRPGAWRRFEVVTRVEIAKAGAKRQAWIPVPTVNEQEWFQSLGSDWRSNGRAAMARDPQSGADMLYVEWRDGEQNPVVEVTSRIAARDRATELAKHGNSVPLSPAENELYTRG